MATIYILRLHLMILFNVFLGTGGYHSYRVASCVFSSLDVSDAEFIDTFYFNKVPYTQFNSTVGKYVGFGEFGVKQAERWNSDTQQLEGERADLERVCKHNAQLDIDEVLTKSVQPKVKLSSVKKVSGHHPAILMCSAYDFYPPTISVSWLRDGKPVTTDVVSTGELADGDWYYQAHSELMYTPKSGEKISCVVEHASFKKPIIYDWDPSLPESERNKIAIGASGLVLGIILSAAGFIYYKKKSSGRILVPS